MINRYYYECRLNQPSNNTTATNTKECADLPESEVNADSEVDDIIARAAIKQKKTLASTRPSTDHDACTYTEMNPAYCNSGKPII